MIIVIDGYNLLKSVFSDQKDHLAKKRDQLVKQLSHYKKQRPKIATIIIVFDGGLFSHGSREIQNDIVIIFSGQRSTADAWIIKFIEKHKNAERLMISNDRKLTARCKNAGSDSMPVMQFYALLQNALQEELILHEQPSNQETTTKHKPDDRYTECMEEIPAHHPDILDLLMEQASLSATKKLYAEEHASSERSLNRTVHRKKSKNERRHLAKLKKL